MTTDAVEAIDRTLGNGAPPPLEQSGCQPAEDVATARYEDTERIKRGQAEEALGELDGAQRDVVEGTTGAVVDRLPAAPILCIRREGDGATLDAVVRPFDLDPDVVADDDEIHMHGSYRPEVTGVAD